MVMTKAIPFAPGYSVTSDGHIVNKKCRRLKPFYAGEYLAVKIHNKNRYIHKLVAEAFVPGCFAGAEINHIDEDKTNNSAENLQWVTHKQNCNHGTRNARAGEKHRKKIAAYKDGKEIARFESLSDAAKQTGVCMATIGRVASGRKGATAGGYGWVYL